MWTPIYCFAGAELVASFIAASLFITKGKHSVWVWAMFVGVVVIAVGGFGYIIPESIPHGDAIIIYGCLLMMMGVFASYYFQSIDASYTLPEQTLILEHRVGGLYLLGIGIAITVCLTFGSAYYLSTTPDSLVSKGLMGTQFLILRKLEQQGSDIQDLKQAEGRHSEKEKESDQWRTGITDRLDEGRQRGEKILSNQGKVLKGQARVLKGQARIGAQVARPNAIIIKSPSPVNLPSKEFNLPTTILALPVNQQREKEKKKIKLRPGKNQTSRVQPDDSTLAKNAQD